MSASLCRWSALRRLSPRLAGGRQLRDWRRADLAFELADGGIAGLVLRRRLRPWETVATAVVTALAQPPAPARLRTAPAHPLPHEPAPVGRALCGGPRRTDGKVAVPPPP